MKACILIILFVLGITFVSALSIDESIDTIMKDANIENHAGESYLIYYNFGGNFPDEYGAYQFIAQAATLFMWVQKGWCDYSSASMTDRIKSVRYIACPYGTEYQDYMAIIPMSRLNSDISEDEAREMDPDEFYNRVLSIVRNHAQIDNLDMFLDE